MTDEQDLEPANSGLEITNALVSHHQLRLWRYLRFLGADPALAEELVQETFLVLCRSRLTDRGSAALAGWLRGVARNLFLAQKRALRSGLEQLGSDELEAAWCRFDRGDAGDRYHTALRSCLDRLPEQQRIAIHLRFHENATREAMAHRLGLLPEGVKTLLRRAKNQLRSCIERRLEREL